MPPYETITSSAVTVVAHTPGPWLRAGRTVYALMHATEQWCRDHGVSCGPTDRSRVRGLLVGEFLIAKWHNLTAKERRECHGTITGDGREGPLFLRISRSALAEADQ